MKYIIFHQGAATAVTSDLQNEDKITGTKEAFPNFTGNASDSAALPPGNWSSGSKSTKGKIGKSGRK